MILFLSRTGEGEDARAAGVLIVETLRGVIAIGQKRVASRDAAEADQSKFAIVGDGGRRQHERIGAAIATTTPLTTLPRTPARVVE